MMLVRRLLPWLFAGLQLACSGSDDTAGGGSTGGGGTDGGSVASGGLSPGAGAASGAGAAMGTGVSSTGATSAGSGGASSGGSGGASTSTGGSGASQPVTSGGAAGAGTGGTGSVTVALPPGMYDCDPRRIRCRMAEPVCPEGQVPRIDGICYGPCVRIDSCVCSEPAACPNQNEFTCIRSQGHCSYYL